MRCIIEVGLSIGDDFSMYAANPRHFVPDGVDYVFGFEPVPHLAEHTRKRAADRATVPFEVIQKAVDLDNTPKKFYPATTDFIDMEGNPNKGWTNGAGSLLKMKDNVEEIWPNRPDVKQKEPIDIECTRLDTFVEERGITQIPILEIDAQGKDLDVLKSLGDYISIVTSGKIEVPEKPDLSAYENSHTKGESLDFLFSHGFSVRKEDVELQNEEKFLLCRS